MRRVGQLALDGLDQRAGDVRWEHLTAAALAAQYREGLRMAARGERGGRLRLRYAQAEAKRRGIALR